jgi:hypothetical protein
MFFVLAEQPYGFWQLYYVKGEVTVDKCSKLQFHGFGIGNWCQNKSEHVCLNFTFIIIQDNQQSKQSPCSTSLLERIYKTLQPWGLTLRGPKNGRQSNYDWSPKICNKGETKPTSSNFLECTVNKKCPHFPVKHIIRYHQIKKPSKSAWAWGMGLNNLPLVLQESYYSHSINWWYGPSTYNNGMLGVLFESKSPCVAFRASHCYTLRAHRMRVTCLVMLCI